MPQQEHCPRNRGLPQQLLTEPAVRQSMSHTLFPTSAEQTHKQHTDSSLLCQPEIHRCESRRLCPPSTHSSQELVGTEVPPATEALALVTDQQTLPVIYPGGSAVVDYPNGSTLTFKTTNSASSVSANAPVCDFTSLVPDSPVHPKRPKTIEKGEVTFAGVFNGNPLPLPPAILQAAERSRLSGDAATLPRPATAPVANEISQSAMDLSSLDDSCADHMSAGTDIETVGAPVGTSYRGGKPAKVCRLLANNETCDKCPLSSREVPAPGKHKVEVGFAAGRLVVTETPDEKQHPSTEKSGHESDCTFSTSIVLLSSRAAVLLPPCQKVAGQSELGAPSLVRTDQLAPYFSRNGNGGTGGKCPASDGLAPIAPFCADGITTNCGDSSRGEHPGSDHSGSDPLPCLLRNKVLRIAPEVPTVEQSRVKLEAATTCNRTALRNAQTVNAAEKTHELGSEGRIYWGKKRGPYDRPVRVLLSRDPQTSSHAGKEQAALNCKSSAGLAGGANPYTEAAETVQMGAEPESSSSMASTRATTPLTGASNGSSSTTSSVGENLSGCAVVPSLAAANSAIVGAANQPSSPRKQQTQTSEPENRAVPQAPPRRLVRLCEDDEEIWNEWEGQSMLGEGVYGRVYLVRSRTTGEERAFKRMYLQVSRFTNNRGDEAGGGEQDEGETSGGVAVANGGLPAVVQREIASLKALQGVRNVIRLEEVFIGSRRVYLSFPVVRGGSLTELLRRYALWQEHLLTLHQTAASACTVPSPTEDPLLICSTADSYAFSSTAHGSLRQDNSDRCCPNYKSDSCDSGGTGVLGPSKRGCCHRSRWDCRSRSSGRCNCSTSTNTDEATCYLVPLINSIHDCRCCTKAGGNSTGEKQPLTSGAARPEQCSKCSKEEGGGTHSTELGIEGALSADSAALVAASRTACHSSAFRTQLEDKFRRSSTCSSKKEDEYHCCGSHACGNASSSVPASTGSSAPVATSLTGCLSTVTAICCCCCCSTLHHGKEHEFDDNAMGSSLSASRSTCAASSSSRSSCPSTTSSHKESCSLISSRSFFSPPFSFPQMPPCGLPLPLAKTIVQAILRGITACHERRIAHRDMKPDNILLDWIPQAPPSPPPPPPSPASSRSTSLGYMKQVGSTLEQSRCCTTVESRCGKHMTCSDNQAVCNKWDPLSSEETYNSNRRACCCSKQRRAYSEQVCCYMEVPQSHCSCAAHMISSEVDRNAELGESATAGGKLATSTQKKSVATRSLLAPNAQTEGNEAVRPKGEQVTHRKDPYTTSGCITTCTAKAAEMERNEGAEANREANTTIECLRYITQSEEGAESSMRRKDDIVLCSRKREPTSWSAPGAEGENAGPRRRKCAEATAHIKEPEVDAAGSGRPDHRAMSRAPVPSAEVAVEIQTTTGVAASAGQSPADSAPAATQSGSDIECTRTSSRLPHSCARPGEGIDQSSASAFVISDALSQRLTDAGHVARGTQNVSKTASVEMELLGEAYKGWNGQTERQKHSERVPEAIAVEVETSAVAAAVSIVQDKEGDALSGSTSSKAAEAEDEEEEEEVSSETQQSEDSSCSPEYPPLPTHLVIADFGLARTLPFHSPLSTSVSLTPPSLDTHQQHDKSHRTQFVLPATAAVPSTRCISSSGDVCWVGYDSGYCGSCCNEKSEKKCGSLAIYGHDAPVNSAKPPTQQPASLHESYSEEARLTSVDRSQCRCKRWRSELPGNMNWQKTCHTKLNLPCGGSTCGTAATENGCCTLWVRCKSASATQQRDEGSPCFCDQSGSQQNQTSAEEMECFPADVTVLPREGAANTRELHEIEEAQDEQEEEGLDIREHTKCEWSPSPQTTPGSPSAAFCLSPEIITLNYRPLDVLLGSSSYSLAVDVWSIGCIFMELLTGCELIDGCTEFQCIVAIMRLFGNPWKQTENINTKACKGCSQTQARRNGDVALERELGSCKMSSSCCRGCAAPLYDVSESCGGHRKAGKPGPPSDAAPAACCYAQIPKTARIAGKLQSACSASGRCASKGREKASRKSHMDKRREWRFWAAYNLAGKEDHRKRSIVASVLR